MRQLTLPCRACRYECPDFEQFDIFCRGDGSAGAAGWRHDAEAVRQVDTPAAAALCVPSLRPHAARLQPPASPGGSHAPKAATVCHPGCNHVHPRLQPCAPQAATARTQADAHGCSVKNSRGELHTVVTIPETYVELPLLPGVVGGTARSTLVDEQVVAPPESSPGPSPKAKFIPSPKPQATSPKPQP